MIKSSFESIYSASNWDCQENYTPKTTYKSSDQTSDTKAKIGYKSVQKIMRKSKKEWLTFEEKLAKVA